MAERAAWIDPSGWDRALTATARALSGHARASVASTSPGDSSASLLQRAEDVLVACGVTVERAAVRLDDMHRLPDLAPFVLVRDDGAAGLVVLSAKRSRITVLDADGTARELPRSALDGCLRDLVADPAVRGAEEIVRHAAIPPGRSDRAVQALLSEWAGGASVATALVLHPEGPRARDLVLDRPVVLAVLGFIVAHVVEIAAVVLAWFVIGRPLVTGGALEPWLVPWGLAILTYVAAAVLRTGAQARVTALAGVRLKRRLLRGTLEARSTRVLTDGVGDLYGRMLEVDALERFLLEGGLLTLTAVIDLVVAGWVLSQGGGGPGWIAALAVWSVVAVGFGARHHRSVHRWTDARLRLSTDLAERLVGHRTRLVQGRRDAWNEEEDGPLSGYLDDLRTLDERQLALRALVGRGWLIVSFAVLAILAAGGVDTMSLAVTVGGILLARVALERMSGALSTATRAVVAARRMRPLLDPHAGRESPGAEAAGLVLATAPRGALRTDGLRFTYPSGDERPVLDGVTLAVPPGGRVRLGGVSGSGKSTLLRLLAGLEPGGTGHVSLGGVPRASLDPAPWRREVGLVPQFDANHTFADTLQWNLGLGSSADADPEQVTRILTALGLDDLVSRMPSGVLQLVGESGWTLSHGEEARVWLARALLAGPQHLLVDEGFAALDARTLLRCVSALDEAPGSVTVTHHGGGRGHG